MNVKALIVLNFRTGSEDQIMGASDYPKLIP